MSDGSDPVENGDPVIFVRAPVVPSENALTVPSVRFVT